MTDCPHCQANWPGDRLYDDRCPKCGVAKPEAERRANRRFRTYAPKVSSPEALAAAIRENCSWFSGVPDSVLAPVIDLLPGYLPAPRENHAIAMAFGVRLGGGRPCVLIQNSGLGLLIDALYGLQHLYKLGVLMIVSDRGRLEWEEPQHQKWGRNTRSVLRVADITKYDLKDKMEVVRQAANFAFDNERPVAVVVQRGNLTRHTRGAGG